MIQKFVDCGKFIWYEDPFEGKAKMALLHAIRKSNYLIQLEKNEAEKKIGEIKYILEMKIGSIRAKNEALKRDLKAMKMRLHAMYFVLFVIVLIWICSISSRKDQISLLSIS